MNLPDNAGDFTASVETETRKLIELGLWPVQRSQLEGWLAQFVGEQERFFAAAILHQLTMRTSKQFESGLCGLFRGAVSSLIFPNEPDLKLLDSLRDPRDQKNISVVPVICEADPPTKSGPLVLRRLQRRLRLSSKSLAWPWQASDSIRSGKVDKVVFVDDFLGSGQQFATFFEQWGFSELLDAASYIYAPVAAHQKGIDSVSAAVPDIHVVTTETLTEADNFFSPDLWEILSQGKIKADEALEWFKTFVKNHGAAPKTVNEMGVGELGLTFGFAHSTPNNTLPILWYQSPSWTPLLER